MQKLIGLGIVLLIVGPIPAFLGWREGRVGEGASEQPVEMPLEQLIARGANGNPHVRIKEFFLGDNYVYQENSKSKTWEHVWIPMVPPNAVTEQGTPKAPNNVRAILKNTGVRSKVDTELLYHRLAQAGVVQGLVINKIASLGHQERKLLQESYPGTDFSQCLIIEEGRKPVAQTMATLMLWGGAALTLLGLGMIIVGVRVQQRRTP